MSNWTVNDIPDQRGRIVLITGANSGLGVETAKALAAHGAHVIMACRSLERGEKARDAILKEIPKASIALLQLDLASLASVREFASRVRQDYKRLDLLFNNAGVMAIPRAETLDGFEMQFGTNHLGHFALTGLLLPLLLITPGSRVVSTSSVARRMGGIRFDDLQGQNSYARWSAYGQSKTSNLLFAFELQTRLAASGAETISAAAHPGYANTNLQATSATLSNSSMESFFYRFNNVLGQSAAMGALPQLYAALSPDVHGGELVGPRSLFGLRGYPQIEVNAKREYNHAAAERLWQVSTELTGVDYAGLQSAPEQV
ncbi:oxidoreductase [Ktedonospora formicarum]|uniref:Short-chain dehydrogenase n=1 Tax=Ktedonospora formicarum TaxID=2778364 RepID=A0A8J3I532_9CHLR|nr:oxidoreductase [Ktedonospora formicarum]GHO46830.1 short-chain dehydrogenase [Ktedonospora formicarum]